MKGKLVCAYDDLGEQRFHNIPEPVRAFRVRPANAIVAAARVEMVGFSSAAPRQRHGDPYERAFADAAVAAARLLHGRMNRTHPRRVEPHGLERQLAERTRAGACLDHVRMVRTGVRQRRQRRVLRMDMRVQARTFRSAQHIEM